MSKLHISQTTIASHSHRDLPEGSNRSNNRATEGRKITTGEIESALQHFERLLDQRNEPQDQSYFVMHKERYRHCIQSVCELFPATTKLADIGSHYLHQAAILALLGFDVVGFDVPEFTGLPFVQRRANLLHIDNITVESLEEDAHLGTEQFQCVLFCEILEHITFNPVRFWEQVYDALIPGGAIYITTPNSLRLANAVSTIKRVLMLHGVGLDVSAILSNVTYGHHWKEYSAAEIRKYFSSLSPDFAVEIAYYSYRASSKTGWRPKGVVLNLVRTAGNLSGIFAEEIGAVVRLGTKTAWGVRPPSYG